MQVQQTIQQVCSRSAAGYAHHDLTGYMAMYAPTYHIVDVSGKADGYLQEQAGIARAIANPHVNISLRKTVRSVTLHGGRAYALLNDVWTSQIPAHGHIPAYTIIRSYIIQSIWVKERGVWHDASGEMTKDNILYQRLPPKLYD